MLHNPVVDTMMARKSIRRFQDRAPAEEVVEAIVRAGQQAPFAYQLCSLLLCRNAAENPFHAPLLFTFCVDSHRLERGMAQRGWKMVTNDLSLLLFGIQDASLLGENMVIAAERLGLGSCYLGNTPYRAAEIVAQYGLPPRVFPLVQLAMGYPAEDPPPRPRYPLDFTLFEDRYPDLDDETVREAMRAMDEGYLAQGYYRRANYQIPLAGDRTETFTFEDYGWTEHISRKAGQWLADLDDILEPLARCGFHVEGAAREERP